MIKHRPLLGKVLDGLYWAHHWAGVLEFVGIGI